VALGLAGVALCLAAPAGPAPDAGQRLLRPTMDPQPPLALAVEGAALQKNAAGGVASLVIKVTAGLAVEQAVVSARTPGNLVFADGSAVKTWNVDLAPGSERSIPVDVIVPADGRYVIPVEVSGTTGGRSIHRGTAYKLLVGVKEPAARVKAGAHEFQAAEAGEPTP
jgi:hypothetical protein